MEEMQILVPVAVKSKLTESLKTALMNEIMQNISRVDHDMSQLISDEKEKVAEQAKINVQAIAPLRAQYEAQRVRMQQVKDKLIADKERPSESVYSVTAGEILVEDGKIIAFRD